MPESTSEQIEETTVGTLSGQSVAAANPCVMPFMLPDGSEETGPSILLVILDEQTSVRVGAGSEIVVGGTRWTVEHVEVNLEGLGHVRLTSHDKERPRSASPSSLDFLFRDSCSLCGGRTGWDGTSSNEMGSLEVGMACTRCPNREWLTNGKVRRLFFESPPSFTPGRNA